MPLNQPRKPAETYEGKPCRKCSGTLRYSSTTQCVVCIKAYTQSPEYKLYRKAYEQSLERKLARKAYRQKLKAPPRNLQEKPCRKCGKTLRYKSGNCVTCIKAYRQLSKYKTYRKTYYQEYQKTPKGKESHTVAVRKNQLKRLDVEGFYTTQEWIALKEQYGNICLRCKRHQSELDRVLEQDHIIPITKGGTNWISNIQPLCRDCNGMGGKGTDIVDYRPKFRSEDSQPII